MFRNDGKDSFMPLVVQWKPKDMNIDVGRERVEGKCVGGECPQSEVLQSGTAV